VVKRAGAPASRGGAAAFRGGEVPGGALPHGSRPADVILLDPERRRTPAPPAPAAPPVAPPPAALTAEQLFQAVFEQAADARVLVDENGRIVRANGCCAALTGYGADEIIGLPLLDTYVLEERAMGVQRMVRPADGIPLRFERRLLRKDGSTSTVEVGTTWLDNGQRLSILHDVGDRLADEEARRLHKARLEALYELSQMDLRSLTGLLDALLERIVRLTASRYGYIYFYDETTELFTLHAWSKGVMPDCAIRAPETVYVLERTGLWGEVVRQRRPIVINDFIAPNPLKKGLPPGHARLIRFMSVPVLSRGRIVAVAGVANKSTDYTDADVGQLSQVMDGAWRIAERQTAEDELRRLAQELEERVEVQTRELQAANRELGSVNLELSTANATLQSILGEQESLQAELAYRALHDPLTGLANRTMFQERLDYAFRTSQRGVAVLWIDLDRFKEVNDIFGHDVGDEMLVAVADRLRDFLRESDDIARLGGDEFAVVLPNVVESEAQRVGERVMEALVNRDAFRLQIGASLGVAWQPPGEHDRGTLMRRADEAMYRAKAMGGGQTVLS
jgi:diguanylate cyclase (GGDEF)-like protein/PAS domain S-box-containing protein